MTRERCTAGAGRGGEARAARLTRHAVSDLPHTSHADQSVRNGREVFAQGDEFVQKITAAERGNQTIKNHGQKCTLRLLKALARRQPVTWMCHCAEDEPHCHRHLLARLIQVTRKESKSRTDARRCPLSCSACQRAGQDLIDPPRDPVRLRAVHLRCHRDAAALRADR